MDPISEEEGGASSSSDPPILLAPASPSDIKQAKALDLQNNPRGFEYFPFPKGFRRKTTDIDMH